MTLKQLKCNPDVIKYNMQTESHHLISSWIQIRAGNLPNIKSLISKLVHFFSACQIIRILISGLVSYDISGCFHQLFRPNDSSQQLGGTLFPLLPQDEERGGLFVCVNNVIVVCFFKFHFPHAAQPAPRTPPPPHPPLNPLFTMLLFSCKWGWCFSVVIPNDKEVCDLNTLTQNHQISAKCPF